MSKKYQTILNKVVAQIKPKKNRIPEIELTIEKINKNIKKLGIKAKASAGGSYAKDTFLCDDHDIDVFVKFDLKYSNEDISTLLKKILSPFKPVSLHGSRDYFQIKNKYNFEIYLNSNLLKYEGDAFVKLALNTVFANTFPFFS